MTPTWSNTPIGRFLKRQVDSYIRYEDRTPSEEELAALVYEEFYELSDLDAARDEVKAELEGRQ